jgi:hypothetical protein
MEEMVRQLAARGLPAYLDLEITVKALGAFTFYSKHKASLSDELRTDGKNRMPLSEIESIIE